MSLHFAYGRSTLSASDWSITVNSGGGNLTGATKYFSLQAQNPVGKNLILASTAITYQTGDSVTFTINSSALTNAEGWTHYVIGVSNTNTPSTFNQIARINIYDMSTGAVDFDTLEIFPLSLTLTEDAQIITGTFVADKLSLPTTNLIYGMRRGVSENNYIYEYNPFSTLTPNDDDVLSGTNGVWLKKEEFSTYVADIAQYGGCGYDIYHLTNFSQVELPTYNADGVNSFKVKYYLLNNSGFTLQPGTGFTLSTQIGGVERTELFDGKIYYRFKGIVTPTTGSLRTTSTITGQTLDFIETDYVYTKANPVTIAKDYIEHGTGIYFDVHVNFLNLEFNNLLPDGYLQIFFSYISPKGVFTPVGTLFEKGIIFNRYNNRRVLPDTGLNVVVGEGEGLIKNFSWYSCNTTVSGLDADTANQKLYVNINGIVFPDIAERTSSVLRAIVDTTPKESKASNWTAYSAVALNAGLTVTVDYECDANLNQKVRLDYPDVIADDWAIFNPTLINIYVQRQSDGEIRKFTGFIPAANNVSQDFTITDWSAGTVVGSVPSVSASFFDPSTNSFTTVASVGNLVAGNYRVAHTYGWGGDTVSDISHSVADGCITESHINGEQVFGVTSYTTIAQIKNETNIYDGITLYCKDTERMYVYDEFSSEVADDYHVLQPVGGVGRWVSTAKDTMRSFVYETSPTVTDDADSGYRVTDKWLDVVEEKEYTLIDSTVGAAVWKQVGGAGESITLSADITWYVSATGDANADGLTVDTPITLEEAANRVFRVVPTASGFMITIEIANGSYTYANDYVFVAPLTEFSFGISLHGGNWVGVYSYPTVDISTREIILIDFEQYCYIENIHYAGATIDNCSCDILNVAAAFGLLIKEYAGYAYIHGTYKFSNSGSYAFYCSNGYLDIGVTTFDGGVTTRSYSNGFIQIGYGGALYLYTNVIITGTFSGKKILFQNSNVILDGGSQYISSLPGDVTDPYPNWLVDPSNTLATTASLGTASALDVGTSANNVVQLDNDAKLPAVDGSALINLPSSNATNVSLDTTNFNNNLSAADTNVQTALETLDALVSGSGGLTVVYTTNITLTANANNSYLLDGTTTVNLPVGVNGDRIGFGDYAGNFTAVPVTINPNGVETIAGLSSLVLDRDHACLELAFYSGNWVITSLESFDDSVGGGLIDGGAGVTLDLSPEPVTPAANKVTIFASNLDGGLYTKDDAGVVTAVGSGEVFADNVFRIQDNADATKQIAFEASGITTDTTRTITVPDSSGTLISTDTLTDKSLYYYDAASKLLKPINIGATDQVLVAKPSLNPPYQFASNGREILNADRTYYVRTDGNDSNNGLTNTAGGAFATWEYAETVLRKLDGNGYSITLIGTGTFTSSKIVLASSYLGVSNIYLEGDIVTPSNCTISISSGVCCNIITYTPVFIKGFKFMSTGASGVGLQCTTGTITINGVCEFGALPTYHMHATGQKAEIKQRSNYTISGNSAISIAVYDQALYDANGSGYTVTINGNITFSEAFLVIGRSSSGLFVNCTYSGGSVTGVRYALQALSQVSAVGTTFPGTIAGTTTGGSVYV